MPEQALLVYKIYCVINLEGFPILDALLYDITACEHTIIMESLAISNLRADLIYLMQKLNKL